MSDLKSLKVLFSVMVLAAETSMAELTIIVLLPVLSFLSVWILL
jgi:hypothetical protein